MSIKSALWTVLAIAVAGFLFSGFLSYRELHHPASATCVPLGSPGSAFALPPCVYGLAMYSAILLFAVLGLAAQHKHSTRGRTAQSA